MSGPQILFVVDAGPQVGGGHVIRSFSLAMMFGILAGVYSSIFICSPILIYLGMRNDSLTAPEAEKGKVKENA